jgi:hypothetical protein
VSRGRAGRGGEPSGNGEVPNFPCPYDCGFTASTLTQLAVHGNVCPNAPTDDDDEDDE